MVALVNGILQLPGSIHARACDMTSIMGRCFLEVVHVPESRLVMMAPSVSLEFKLAYTMPTPDAFKINIQYIAITMKAGVRTMTVHHTSLVNQKKSAHVSSAKKRKAESDPSSGGNGELTHLASKEWAAIKLLCTFTQKINKLIN